MLRVHPGERRSEVESGVKYFRRNFLPGRERAVEQRWWPWVLWGSGICTTSRAIFWDVLHAFPSANEGKRICDEMALKLIQEAKETEEKEKSYRRCS